MSYDLAVWEGDRPEDDTRAAELFDALFDELETEDPEPPSARIAAFMDEVLEHWPDSGVDHDDFPWAVAPVMPESASGGTVYLTLTVRKELDAQVSDIARLAREHGLHAYDPQREELIS